MKWKIIHWMQNRKDNNTEKPTSLIRTFPNSNILFCPLKKKTFLFQAFCHTSALFQYWICGGTIDILLHLLPGANWVMILPSNEEKKDDIEIKEQPPACTASFEVDKAVTILQQYNLFCDLEKNQYAGKERTFYTKEAKHHNDIS